MMTRKPFKLPDIGEGTAEAELVAWHVNVGDMVGEDQPLFDVMTDKATVEITAPFAGKLVERLGVPGDMVSVGSVVLSFETDDGKEPELQIPLLAEAQSPLPLSSGLNETQGQERRVLSTPAVRKRALDTGVALSEIKGSGPHGRIRQSDLDAYLETIKPEGAGVRATVSTPATALTATIPQVAASSEFDEVPVIGLRRRIAERMQDTKRRIPHFSYIEEIDVTQLETLRGQLNAARSEFRPKLTLLPFLIRALSQVMPEFPQVNALYDDVARVVRRYSAVHAGIATQTPQGLVVSVLRDAAAYDIWGIATEVSRLSDLARSGRAASSDLSGSTITITSLGAMGGVATTPVINSPEVAIIGVNKVLERPVVVDGQIRIAKMMNLSSSFDHRIVDGWDAASFIQRVKTLLETPALLFFDH
jgi:2-oxoisovalerate dehydrogenase E2 component (dihydrolipoyl transacylase)